MKEVGRLLEKLCTRQDHTFLTSPFVSFYYGVIRSLAYLMKGSFNFKFCFCCTVLVYLPIDYIK